MRIVIVGTGFVGLVTGAGFADFGNEVLCVDVDPAKIQKLESGEIPFYEPGLQDLVIRNVRERRLRFGSSLAEATVWGEVVFICVGTPSGPRGEADLSQVFGAAKTIAGSMPSYRLIVQKSTVPVGTAERLSAWISKYAKRRARFDVASNPEFLREGTAVDNFMRPDRIVIGAGSDRARTILRDLYRPLYLLETPAIVTDIRTAELLKYAANAFLATKISFINEMANLADALGANVNDVAKGMGLDRRIGSKFLHPGPGYGGSCLPKDTKALRHFSGEAGVKMRVVSAAIDANDNQLKVAVEKILRAIRGRGPRTVAVLGLSFKPETDDMRAAPSLGIIRALQRRKVAVRVYDPVVRAGTFGAPKNVFWAEDPYEAARGADAVAIVTEWNEFRRLDLPRLRRLLRRRAFVDLRNVYDPPAVRRLGFEYTSVGEARVKVIHGVYVKPLRLIPDERGYLMEMMRNDDPFFQKFGQTYVSVAYPGVVKGWHYHRKQTDHFVIVKGMMKVVLYDERPDSPTKGLVNEFFMGERNPVLITIPPGVWHGMKCISQEPAMLVNTPTEPYHYADPDEVRADPHKSHIPYDWSRKDG